MSDGTIDRDCLVRVVSEAARQFLDAEDRRAVIAFAATTESVLVGAWCRKYPDGRTFRCPSSAVGIDRLQPDAGWFAAAFDELLGVQGESFLLDVIA